MNALTMRQNRKWSIAGLMMLLVVLMFATAAMAQDGERKVIARGAESYGPVTPIETIAVRSLATVEPWKPGDPIKEVPRRVFPAPDAKPRAPAQGLPDPLPYLQLNQQPERAPTITVGVNIDGQGFTGASPPDTVGDVGPDHYVQAVNASQIAIYDKTGTLLPGYPISLESLAPSAPCTSGSGDPIVLYDWLADRWFLQEFTGGGTLCIYVSTTPDPTGTYSFYSFNPPSFPDYPHYGVWPDAYYAATNEAGGAGNQTTYAFDRVNMLAGNPATMQRLTVVPPLSAYGFQTLTPADHDGDMAPPMGAPGIFMRHNDDEAHGAMPNPATDFLEMWEMSVDFATPANTTVTALPTISVTDFNSWMVNYTTFFTTSQPGSGTLLDAIREAILQRLVYRNFGSHETLLGVFATNRDPATSGSNVEQGNRWFELRRTGGGWSLHDEGTFAGDTNSSTANFFMGSVSMDRQGDIALGYSTTDTGPSPVFPSVGFTGRLAVDAAGTMGPENNAVIGGGASGTGRWGDYAALSVDPADDCTFWFTTEYIASPSNWSTRIASFVFEECLFGFILSPTPAEVDVCAPTDPDPTFNIDVTSVGGWSFAVDLGATGTPAGTTTSFAPDNQLPNFTSTLTVMNTDSAASGNYTIDISGTGTDTPPTTRNSQVVLNLAAADPGAVTLTGPPTNPAKGTSLLPTFTWSAASDAFTYLLEVATDDAFSNIVISVPGLTGLSHTATMSLDPTTDYFWRVTAENVCNTTVSAVGEFRTNALACQTFDSTNVPLPIPEGGGTAGVTMSTLTVASGGTIADVNVLNMSGTHTFMGDLDFNVVSPGNTSVVVLPSACGTDENFDINFDDDAPAGAPPCPPTDGGTYQPFGSLSDFGGENSTGDWMLVINDNANGDSGQLDSWSLEICIEVSLGIFADGFESGNSSAWSAQVP